MKSTDFGSHVLGHPRFRFLARFFFPSVDCCSRDENILETRYKKISLVRWEDYPFLNPLCW